MIIYTTILNLCSLNFILFNICNQKLLTKRKYLFYFSHIRLNTYLNFTRTRSNGVCCDDSQTQQDMWVNFCFTLEIPQHKFNFLFFNNINIAYCCPVTIGLRKPQIHRKPAQ